MASISDGRWQQVLAAIPQKREEMPDDFFNKGRVGPGIMNTLSELRREARAEAAMIANAQAELATGGEWVDVGAAMLIVGVAMAGVIARANTRRTRQVYHELH